MALYVVGEFIKETRIRRGYTQENVCLEICTPASMSRIENGAQMPGRTVLEKLLERLGVENDLFNLFVDREELELYETVQAMIRDITDGNLEALEQHIAKVEGMTVKSTELERQCLLFAKGELSRQKRGDADTAMQMFMQAIHITLSAFDGKTPLRENLLTFDEIMIINSIAVLHAGENSIRIALELEFWLKEYMESHVAYGKMKTTKYPMILYNLSNWLAKEGRYREVLEIAEQGVNFCIKFGNLVALPFLVFNQAAALAELGEMEKAKKYFNQSIVIFETMKKQDKVQHAVDWCRSHYKIEF